MTTNTPLRDRCTLTLPNNMGYIPVALGFVRSVAEYPGFGGVDQRRIELALEETETNVIKHGYAPDKVANFTRVSRLPSAAPGI